jgi:drug/metabolite transporter (DMT)-like permease
MHSVREAVGTTNAGAGSTARVGTVMALISAAAFGSSGPMAKALLETGWSAGAVVLVRLGAAAIVLTLAAAVALRGRWRPRVSSLRTLDVGVALLIEYLAPVLLLGWVSLRTRRLPGGATLLAAGLTLVGLAFVLELMGTIGLDPVGVAWALGSAVCLAAFFVISAQQDADLPPLVMAAGGTLVGALVIGVAGVIGVVPLAFSTADVVLAGMSLGWWVPTAWLALVATVLAYLTGIGGILRLGSRSASFVALTEVLFAVLVSWALLAELPGWWQLLGGTLIVVGIVGIRRQERAGVAAMPAEHMSVP